MASNNVTNYFFISFKFNFNCNFRTSYKDRAKYIANTGFFPETLEVCLDCLFHFLTLF